MLCSVIFLRSVRGALRSLESDGEDIVVGLKLFNDLLSLRGITFEKYIGDAGLSLLEDNVLELLHVPSDSSEDLEAVR